MMTLVSSLSELVQHLACVMTAPTFEAFVTVLTGRVYARHHTVPGAILATDTVGVSAKVEIRILQGNLDFFQQ